MKILGISAYYHDSAACLLVDDDLIAAAQEERFSRKRHDPGFPVESIRFCLKKGNISLSDLDGIIYYDKPFLTFERLLETYLSFAPKGLRSFLTAMPIWLKEKLFLRKTLKEELKNHFQWKESPRLYFSEHHESHAASAFYPSPFQEAAVLCLDGVGEWATTSAWLGSGNELDPLWELKFPHSLGLLYSAFTYHAGFKVNSGEYKVMGLAPYGRPIYVQPILDHLMDLKEDGTFRLNLKFFDYCAGLKMTHSRFDSIFGGPPRKPESLLTQREMDLARSIQDITEEVVLRLAKTIQKDTGLTNLCLAGGVALNCVANGRVLRESPFKNIWIQPAAGDAGGAVGSAYSLLHRYFRKPRRVRSSGSASNPTIDAMKGSFLGPSFDDSEIRSFLEAHQIPYSYYEDSKFYQRIAKDLAEEKIVGWFRGPMEFGPRALGARSIIGDARSKKMQSIMNLKIKFRESFRPFAPSVLRERVADYFELSSDSPYMLLVAPVKKERRIPLAEEDANRWGIDLLNIPKSEIPAVTHVDYSARIQTVHRETNPKYYQLIQTFEELSGCPVLVNTSFNVRGEPIVCSPKDAYVCFMRTDIDTLVLENFVLDKTAQSKKDGLIEELNDKKWRQEFTLD